MTDQTPDPALVPVPAIVVNADPLVDQGQALLRQGLVAAAAVVAAFGLAKASGELNLLASLAGPILTVLSAVIGLAALIWGQIKTRVLSQKAKAMADQLPDAVARTK